MASALLRLHRWIAQPRFELPEEQFELYAMTNWAMALGLASHVTFIPLFVLLEVPILAAVNVVSMGCFVFALWFSRRAKFVASLLIGAVEVVAHAWIATLFLGWSAGFHLHAILALVLLTLFSPVKLATRVSYAVAIAAAYVALVATATHRAPVVSLAESTQVWLGVMNAVIFLGATTGMAAYHTWTVTVTRHARAAAQTQAEAASRAKSNFLANMSHELRTPLNAILGYSEMIAEDADDEALQADAHKIHGAGRHLLTLINDVLDLSKIEAGRMEVLCVPFDLQACITEVVDTIRPLAETNDDLLEVEVADDIGEMTSDGTKVRQILLNLLSNACKFTQDGTIRLDVREAERFGEPHLCIVVTDTGIGMTAEELAKIFLEFTQADQATSEKYGGTGLGLAITKRFCELLGGEIDVTSQPGKGTTFTVFLPMDASALSRLVASA